MESVSSLVGVLHDMTEVEIHRCIALEADGQRRKSIIMPLVRRAARLNRQQFLAAIAKKHHIEFDITE